MSESPAREGSVLDTSRIDEFHAHVYYDKETRQRAGRLREAIAGRFEVTVGSWHDEPVGPHPQAMYLISFGADQFQRLVPWLMLNRDGLTVLVHAKTDESSTRDHTDFAMWLGPPLDLRLGEGVKS
ncbi:MAG: DOPA 4,5-dioxygenase family protein [Proteobacteria bacterium]|nr:DOPA 4,5-dioxygenase family protein [Pseudomonadota bacterium]